MTTTVLIGHFVRNLETQKLQLHFDKEGYKALPQDLKQKVKAFFNWSSRLEAWVSKGKYNSYSPVSIARNHLNLEDKGNINEPISFAEQIERKAEKADIRAERYESLSNKLSNESDKSFNNAFKMVECIPAGQPILVGHHSEKRHRALLGKSDNAMRKGFDLEKKAEYYSDKANSVSTSVNIDNRLNDFRYLNNRIKESKARIAQMIRNGYKVDGESVTKEKEKLDFYTNKVASIGGFKFNKENLKEAHIVKYRGSWFPVVRLNPSTVTFSNWLGVEKMTWKASYSDISEAKDKEGKLINTSSL